MKKIISFIVLSIVSMSAFAIDPYTYSAVSGITVNVTVTP